MNNLFLRKWWFWSIVVFVLMETLGLYLVFFYGINYNREWKYWPFNQSDAIAVITIPVVISVVPFVIANWRKGGIVPSDSRRGRLFQRFSVISALTGVFVFIGLNFWLEMYDYHFLSVSTLLIGFMLAAVLTTSVKPKILEKEVNRPPLFYRLAFISIVVGLNIAMFINMNHHPVWIYLIATIIVIWSFGRISKRYQ